MASGTATTERDDGFVALVTQRIGGPLGRHAGPTGTSWLNPTRVALLTATVAWIIAAVQKLPCQVLVAGHYPDSYRRLCYSDIPLLVSGAFGGLLMIGSLLWGIWLAITAASGAGSSSVAIVGCAVLGIGGLILVNLGIVGAYLGRAAREAKERPMYFVAETAGLVSPSVECSQDSA